jgi:phosphate uptake regulator
VISGEVRPVLARMSLLASQLAEDAAFLGRYYERFGDHAVTIAQQVCYLATGLVTSTDAVETATAPASTGRFLCRSDRAADWHS